MKHTLIHTSILQFPFKGPATHGLEAGCYWSNSFQGKQMPGYNRKHLSPATEEECKSACETEKEFKCKSFDYYVSGGDTGCYLADADRYDAAIEDAGDYNYYEIICATGE